MGMLMVFNVHSDKTAKRFWYDLSVLYLSRIESETALNGHFQQKLEAGIHPEIKALSDGKGRHRIGDVDRNSQALIFTETSAAELLEEEIKIDVRAVDFSNNELGGVCAGIVSRVGSAVAQLKEGDIVCGLAFPDHASTVVLILAAYYCRYTSTI